MKQVNWILFPLFIACMILTLQSCKQGEIHSETPSPSSREDVITRPEKEATPVPTLTDEEIKYRSKYPPGPTPTPLPMGINSYGCEPGIFYTRGGQMSGQLLIFINQIVNNWTETGSIAFRYEGKPAKDVSIIGISLFEAQDLIVTLKVDPRAKEGQYDALLRIGNQDFFLKNVFEVRQEAPPRIRLPQKPEESVR